MLTKFAAIRNVPMVQIVGAVPVWINPIVQALKVVVTACAGLVSTASIITVQSTPIAEPEKTVVSLLVHSTVMIPRLLL